MRTRLSAAVERRYGARLELSTEVDHLEALTALNERSVCRRYRPDAVPEDVIRLLCATALAAPTKSDLQQASLVRVADPATRKAICALLPGSPWLLQAPELFVFCAAELAGLGSCPISQIRDHIATIERLLALPDWVVPVAGLALGYPEAKEPMSARLALSATVHTDRYDDAAVERELDAYDARRGRPWSADKVKQYSTVWRADFGAFVTRKRWRLV